MSEIPYTPLAGKIEEYFRKFQEAGVPPKVNRESLESLGFTSSNDRYMIKVLRLIGFTDSKNLPTELYQAYKNPVKAPGVLAQAIRTGYSDLFKTYEDAYRKDREALYAYFSSKTGKAKRTIDLMVNTFQKLCQIADFEVKPVIIPKKEVIKKPEMKIEERVIKREKGVISEIHINIQLHLPATDDGSVYDNLFKSLKKHLLSAD